MNNQMTVAEAVDALFIDEYVKEYHLWELMVLYGNPIPEREIKKARGNPEKLEALATKHKTELVNNPRYAGDIESQKAIAQVIDWLCEVTYG